MEGGIVLKKINDVKVKQVKTLFDDKPYKHIDMFPVAYPNVFISSKKFSGKTTNLYNILKECATNKTKVEIFSATAENDSTMKTIVEKLNFCSIKNEVHDSIWDEDDEGTEFNLLTDQYEDVKELVKKKRKQLEKDKLEYPLQINIFDDISECLRDKSLEIIIKKNRHNHTMNVISSQYWNDLTPACRTNMDFIILYSGIPQAKLKQIHEDKIKLLTLDQFVQLYNHITSEPYTFLYINCQNPTDMRKNYDQKIELGKIIKESLGVQEVKETEAKPPKKRS